MNWVNRVLQESDKVMYGKTKEVKLALMSLLTGGNLLIEDTPGVGKTTLVKFLGKSLALKVNRIQFTNDLLPADILGTSIFNPDKNEFSFREGPIFGELILADELNRGNSKTQSALLQAMEERKVSIDGKNYDLPKEHILVATQNPNSQIGTFPLPESQLDRFMMKISMGPPAREREIELLMNQANSSSLSETAFSITKAEYLETQNKVLSKKLSLGIAEYIVSLLETSRKRLEFTSLSPRSGIDLLNAVKAYSFIENKDKLGPEDVQFLFPYVMGHRLVTAQSASIEEEAKKSQELIDLVNVY